MKRDRLWACGGDDLGGAVKMEQNGPLFVLSFLVAFLKPRKMVMLAEKQIH